MCLGQFPAIDFAGMGELHSNGSIFVNCHSVFPPLNLERYWTKAVFSDKVHCSSL